MDVHLKFTINKRKQEIFFSVLCNILSEEEKKLGLGSIKPLLTGFKTINMSLQGVVEGRGLN